jgi:hypothetical protein
MLQFTSHNPDKHIFFLMFLFHSQEEKSSREMLLSCFIVRTYSLYLCKILLHSRKGKFQACISSLIDFILARMRSEKL